MTREKQDIKKIEIQNGVALDIINVTKSIKRFA